VNDGHEPDSPVESTYKGKEGPGFAETEDELSKLDRMPSTTSVPPHIRAEESSPHTNGAPQLKDDAAGGGSAEDVVEKDDPADSTSQSRGTSIAEQAGSTTTTADAMDGQSDDMDTRLDALAREKQALREEVAALRKSIEGMQGKHKDVLGELKEHLEGTQGEKEHAETQYRTLLGKVNTIKSQLGERLKADAVRIYPMARGTSLIQA